ncbi:MAG: DUF2480 family protein [Bacteroidetes bacterium]|nr:MAG: DUF2480 family protein [Bacteroidota bacterium]
MPEEIINRVAQSALQTLNLEDLYPAGERMELDIKDQLFQGLILREKDFREFVKTHDWTQYSDAYVAVYCSADAIVPTWAYMLIASKLQPYANYVLFGSLSELESHLFMDALNHFEVEEYRDKPVVVKGCFDKPIPTTAYMEITRKLAPVAKSIMYGEPCSTVPIFKRK